MKDPIKVYGADWCEDTQRTRRQLETMGEAYDYIDVDRDEDADQQVRQWNGGRRITPTVVLRSGNVATGEDRLAAPSNEELSARLQDERLGRAERTTRR